MIRLDHSSFARSIVAALLFGAAAPQVELEANEKLVGDEPIPVEQADILDERWTLSIGAETVTVNPDGSFIIPNIAAPDEFGPNGPGTQPDFLSDDWLRLTGYATIDEKTRYVWSEPFRVIQGETIVFSDSDLTFSDSPPPIPKSILAVPTKKTLTTIGETTQMQVTAFLRDESAKDVTTAAQYTTYRTSNLNFASVSADGLVTAKKEGKVFITAINEGVTSVTQINITPGAGLTQIVGVVTLPDGTPVAGAEVVLAGLGLSAETNATGGFVISDVPISDVVKIDAITVQSISEAGVFFGSTTAPELLAGQITDAGLIELMDLCDQLGEQPCIDSDDDCLPDWIELVLGLDPNNPDTDGNTVPDGEEDPDLDGLTNCAEIFLGTDPELADSDNDGLDDGEEVFAFGTNPRNGDSDFDGLKDGDELFPPNGLPETDPFRADTDLDGIDDGLEIAAGTNPLDAASRPPVRVYSAEVDFLNALFGDAIPAKPEMQKIASGLVSFLNAVSIESPSPASLGKMRVSTLVVSFENEIEPTEPAVHTRRVASLTASFLNADPAATPDADAQPILASSKRVSFLNIPTAGEGDEKSSIQVVSDVVYYLNQP